MQEFPVAPLNLAIAAPFEQRQANALASLALGLPRLLALPECELGRLNKAALVSGGPSSAHYLDGIRQFEVVVACGSSCRWLVENGITPTYCVIFDPGADQARFYAGLPDPIRFLVASTCDPSVFEALSGRDVHVWHPFDDLPWELYGGEPRVGGGSTVTLRAIAVAHILGLRELHLFGFDCCYVDAKEHAYPYDQDRPAPIAVSYGGRQFVTTPQLLQQAQEFMRLYHDHEHEIACKVYGDGLIAFMMKSARGNLNG